MSFSLERERTAVLFLDFQVDVCDREGKLMRQDPVLLERFMRVRERAGSVLQALRQREQDGQHVCYAHIGRLLDHTQSDLRNAHQNRLEAYLSQHKAFAVGSKGATFVEELEPAEGEQILWKQGMSALSGTSLAHWLHRRSIDTLVMAGVVTHYAVLATAFDAIDRGFQVLLLEDCCTSRDPRRHRAAMELLAPLTESTTAQAFCGWLAQEGPLFVPEEEPTQDTAHTPPTGPIQEVIEVAPEEPRQRPREPLHPDEAIAQAQALVEKLQDPNANAPGISDDECIDCIEQLSQALSMGTNAEQAATRIFGIAIPICTHRPHLAIELFPFAMFGLLAVFYHRFDDQRRWLKQQMRKRQPFGGLSVEPLNWLRGMLEEETTLRQCFQVAVWWEHAFPENEESVPGLLYVPELITKFQEKQLIQLLDRQRWHREEQQRIQQYGYRHHRLLKQIDEELFLGALPDWALDMARTLYERGFCSRIPDQVDVVEYQPGQGHPPHIELPQGFDEMIAFVSLGSSSIMDFQHKQGARYSKWIAPRSLLLLSGEARYDWTHAIEPRKTDPAQGRQIDRTRRLELVFRSVLLRPPS